MPSIMIRRFFAKYAFFLFGNFRMKESLKGQSDSRHSAKLRVFWFIILKRCSSHIRRMRASFTCFPSFTNSILLCTISFLSWNEKAVCNGLSWMQTSHLFVFYAMNGTRFLDITSIRLPEERIFLFAILFDCFTAFLLVIEL